MIWRASGSLRVRLMSAMVLIALIGGAAMLVELRRHSRQPDELIEDSSLATQARAYILGMRFDSAGRLVSVKLKKPWRRAYSQPQAAFYTLYDAQGHAVARSSNLTQPLAPIPLAAGEAISSVRLVGPDQDLAVAARAPGGYQLTVARSNPGRIDQSAAQRWADFIPGAVFAVFALASLVAVWLVAAWSLRPLGLAAREAALIGPERPDARLTANDLPSEVRPMAVAVNQALDRVAAAYASEKRFTAEAAHALRTPLAVLDLRLQRAEQGGRIDWPDVRADLAELSRVVTNLLTLSRADRMRPFRAETDINLTRLVRETAAAFSPRLEKDDRVIAVAAPDQAVSLRGEPGELREMLFALVDNALTHGRGEILVELTRDGDAAVIAVSDQGLGVPTGQAEAMFERFHKADGASPGAGLGLAIVRQTARNHAGEARFAAPATLEVRLRGLVA